MRRYLRDPTFSRFDTIPECDGHTHTHTDRQRDRHTTTAYTALSIASRGKNQSVSQSVNFYSALKCCRIQPYATSAATSSIRGGRTLRLNLETAGAIWILIRRTPIIHPHTSPCMVNWSSLLLRNGRPQRAHKALCYTLIGCMRGCGRGLARGCGR